jgi:hypothetical protein
MDHAKARRRENREINPFKRTTKPDSSWLYKVNPMLEHEDGEAKKKFFARKSTNFEFKRLKPVPH